MNVLTSLRSAAKDMARTSAAGAALAAVLAASAPATTVQAQGVWNNVRISAGSGFVTGIVAQPKVRGLFYIRTDVGGVFRWDAPTESWIPITDFLPVQQRGEFSAESLAIDPNRPNTVYMACGGGLKNEGSATPGTIYQSSDRGATWTPLGLTGVYMSGNAAMRWGGERLAIEPDHSKVMLFGSRTQGLWRAGDGGAHWTHSGLPYPQADDISGVQAIAFDPSSPRTVYAAVAKNGIYQSTNSGSTWTNISTKIIRPERLVVGPDSTVWVTYHNGVSKFAGGTWTDCTPRGATANAYCGLAVNPSDPKNVIVSYGLWGDPAPTAMFETANSGTTWTKLAPRVTTNVPWYLAMDPGTLPGTIKDFLFTPISNFLFDPHNPASVWFVSAGGIFHTPDIARRGGPIFSHQEKGHEQLCVTALATPPRGPELIAGVTDVDGFVFDKGILAYPSRTFLLAGTNAGAGATAALAYEESNPRNMVRLCVAETLWNSPTLVVTSSDGGFVWKQDKSFPTAAPSGGRGALAPLAVALSATDPDNMVVEVRDNGDRRAGWFSKKHGSADWKPCSGLPFLPAPELETMPIAADPIAAGTFYAYVGGAIYRSTEGGVSFQQRSGGLVGAPGNADFFKLAARPGATGDLWLSEDNDTPNYRSDSRAPWEGLYHSSDAGQTWTKLPGITRALTFSFGKASSRGQNTLFYYGRREGDSVDRIFRSTDLGNTWVNIQHPGQAIGDGPWVMEGSRQTFGRVFIGTEGRGIFYSTADRAGH